MQFKLEKRKNMKTEIYLYVLEFLKLVQEKIPTTVARHRLELDENNAMQKIYDKNVFIYGYD